MGRNGSNGAAVADRKARCRTNGVGRRLEKIGELVQEIASAEVERDQACAAADAAYHKRADRSVERLKVLAPDLLSHVLSNWAVLAGEKRVLSLDTGRISRKFVSKKRVVIDEGDRDHVIETLRGLAIEGLIRIKIEPQLEVIRTYEEQLCGTVRGLRFERNEVVQLHTQSPLMPQNKDVTGLLQRVVPVEDE